MVRALAVAAIVTVCGGSALDAACCYFSAKNADILQPAQKVFITFDPKEKMETFTVQPKFEGNALDFGMVIPTPTQPKLHEMPKEFFKHLAYYTILKKRENFRKAFHGFDAARIARYRAKDIARLMADAGIVRNKLKVEATIDNARALLKLQERTSLAAFLWGFLDGRPQINTHRSFKTVPAETATSKAISKALKAEGFRFVGPTTVYAFMQATGMVNDHLVNCMRHEPCAKLQRSFKLPGAVSGT